MFAKNPKKLEQSRYRLKLKPRQVRRFELKRGLQLIPNLFTLGNAIFGFCSIIFAAEGEFVAAAYCIFLGAMMDSLDGQLARLFSVASDLGLQLDSLSDAVTFCVAPAFLIYSWKLYKFGFIGIAISGVLLMCGVFRLAKFNITASEQTQYFIGVPTPIVACFIASVVLNFTGGSIHFLGKLILSLIVLIISCLMVSFVRVPTFKHVRKGWYVAAIAAFAGVAVVFSFVKTILLFFTVYFIFVLAKYAYDSFVQRFSYYSQDRIVNTSEEHFVESIH